LIRSFDSLTSRGLPAVARPEPGAAHSESALGDPASATTVTQREHDKASLVIRFTPFAETAVYDESVYDSGAVYAGDEVIHETWVLGESPLGSAVLGDDDAPKRLEAILGVIGSGSFPKPGPRDSLNSGQRHQLRDAMILEAHAREGRDILVSDDVRGFIGKTGEKRPKLEAICRTRIMTTDEFCDCAERQRREDVSEGV
jgi:hypothetical protein